MSSHDLKQIALLVIILAKNPDDTVQSSTERADAFHELVGIGAAAVPTLIDALDTTYNYFLARALVEIGESAVEPLIDALHDANAVRRANAAYTLALMEDERAAPALIEALDDEDANVRKEAASAFTQLHSAEAVLRLCEALGDEEQEVRVAAAAALGTQGDVRAIDALREAFLKDEDEQVRRAAQAALKDMGNDPTLSEMEVAHEIEAEALKMLSETVRDTSNIDADSVGGPKVELLIATLESDDFIVQRRAARELVKLDYQAVNSLIAALQSHNPTVRAHAAWVLGEIGDPRAMEALEETVQDDDDEVRYASQQALLKLKNSPGKRK